MYAIRGCELLGRWMMYAIAEVDRTGIKQTELAKEPTGCRDGLQNHCPRTETSGRLYADRRLFEHRDAVPPAQCARYSGRAIQRRDSLPHGSNARMKSRPGLHRKKRKNRAALPPVYLRAYQ